MEMRYMIKDEQGNYATKYSFQKIPQGRGKKSKWFYFSFTGYMSGMCMYPDNNGSIADILNYLIHINDRLMLNKRFHIVEIDRDNRGFEGKIISEELNV
jgi:hypothetical protein